MKKRTGSILAGLLAGGAILVALRRGSLAELLDSTGPGLRLNNPGLIEIDGSPELVGEVVPSTHSRYRQFVNASAGIHALVRHLQAIIAQSSDTTLTRVISAWAVRRRSDPANYVEAVSKLSGIAPDQDVSSRLRALVLGVIAQELGSVPYRDIEISQGINMARVPAWGIQ